MDGQAYESGNKPFLPRASAPSVLRLSIFSGTHRKRGTRRQGKRERERERKLSMLQTENIPELYRVLRLEARNRGIQTYRLQGTWGCYHHLGGTLY